MTITYANTATIEAGKPYIVKPTNDNLVNPVFTGVTIDKTMRDVTVGGARFKGTYGPVTLTANDRKKLFLASNTLWYPTADVTVKTCRAYFELTDDVPETAGNAPSIVIDYGDDATAIDNVLTPEGRSVAREPLCMLGKYNRPYCVMWSKWSWSKWSFSFSDCVICSL